MFQGLFKRAERSLDSVVERFVGRALIAIPLLVAGGFATAALTVKLVELYGSVTGYGLMAALFAVIGLVTMAIVNINARSSADASAESEKAPSATADNPGENATDVADLLTPEMRSILASAAPMALPGVLRGVGRNLPLILFLALVGFVISQLAGTSDAEAKDAKDPNAETPDTDPAAAAATSAAAAAAAA